MSKLPGAQSMVAGNTPGGGGGGGLKGAGSLVAGITQGGVPARTFDHSDIHQGRSNDLGQVKVSSSAGSARAAARGRSSSGTKPGAVAGKGSY